MRRFTSHASNSVLAEINLHTDKQDAACVVMNPPIARCVLQSAAEGVVRTSLSAGDARCVGLVVGGVSAACLSVPYVHSTAAADGRLIRFKDVWR
jgi:hypothetical protein